MTCPGVSSRPRVAQLHVPLKLTPFLCILLASGSALAEPAALPSAPEVPKDLPGAPAAPSLPAAPLPGAAAGPKPPSPAPAAPAAPAGVPPTSGPTAAVAGPAEDIEIKTDEVPRTPSDSLPATLPNALRVRAGKGGQAQAGGGLTIEETVNPQVTTVSNRREGAMRAPALVITLTAKDLTDRGYTDLSQVLDDLPGMDVIRPYGRKYARSYWRGYRTGTGADPYLLLVDGLAISSLFFRDAQILASIPMTNIDHIEIVYGPGSVVYGAIATSGMINIVTVDGAARQQAGEYGSNLTTRVTYGGPQRNLSSVDDSTKLVDATASLITKDFRVRVSARVEQSTLDRSIGKDFEFTKPQYYEDRRLWGSVASQNPGIAGSFSSGDEKIGVDARLWIGHFELGAQMFSQTTGLGTMLAGDRFQNGTPWANREANVFLRHTGKLLPTVFATTSLRYRESSLTAPTSLLMRQASTSGFTESGPRLTGLSAPNHAVEFEQRFDADVGSDLLRKGDQLTAGGGLFYRQERLSTSVHTSSNIFFPNGAASSPVDQSTTANLVEDGRTSETSDSLAAFALAGYGLMPTQWFNAGARVEHRTRSDETNLILRGGYVGTFDPVTVKVLYGEAALSRSPYDYSVSPDHVGRPKARNIEANATLTIAPVSFTLAGWNVHYDNPIANESVSLTSRDASGIDATARLMLRPISLWLYYSRYLQAEEQPNGDMPSRPIGDLADNKLWGGITYDRADFVATLLGRWVGVRETVQTNPLGRVNDYLTVDANVLFKNVLIQGSLIGLRCTNLLDARIYHPGVGAADSGDTPGVFTAGGGYVGSRGTFNSLLPQPGRSLLLTIGLEL